MPVVVDFWAEWCGPCRTLTPALEAAETARGGGVVLAKVDVDANQALAARFSVQGIPAVKAFRGGSVVNEFVGAVPKAKVDELFDSLLPSRADELLAAGDESPCVRPPSWSRAAPTLPSLWLASVSNVGRRTMPSARSRVTGETSPPSESRPASA